MICAIQRLTAHSFHGYVLLRAKVVSMKAARALEPLRPADSLWGLHRKSCDQMTSCKKIVTTLHNIQHLFTESGRLAVYV